jgi:hypothetical protein
MEMVMKRNSYIVVLAAIFIFLSGFIYFLHYLLFRDAHHIFLFLVGDLAFLPLEVFLVGVVIERLLSRRESRLKMEKMNMVVGAFFSEVGNHLLRSLLPNFANKEEISSHLNVDKTWTKKDFQKAAVYAHNLPIEVDINVLDFVQLKEFLAQKREFLLRLLENASLLEHDRFADLLWAVTHMDEELTARSSLVGIPEHDAEHLAGDLRRMYDHLASEWLDYVSHLQVRYPYLFSLVLRIHPFQLKPSPIVA